MEKTSAPSINLAKNRGENLSERILTFALTIGRVLVIVTEAIALGAFLFRFGLDRQLVDLHDRITQEQTIVNLLKSDEATYRNLQDRLALASNILTTAKTSESLYQDILALIPSDMSLTSVSLSNKTINIQGSLPTLVSLSAFVTKLKSDSRVDSISLDKIENKSSEGLISVAITITLKPIKTLLL